MSFDRLDAIIEDRFDDSDRQSVPRTHTFICDVEFDAPADYQELTLRDWLDGRATALLGDAGAEHLDTEGLVSFWVEEQVVEVIDDAWYFTRADEPRLWLSTTR